MKFLSSVVAACAWVPAIACTGFYVGKQVSEDGSVLVARTVDLSPWTTSHRLKVTPRVENAPGRVYESVNGFRWELPATTWKFVSTPQLKSMGRGDFDSACANEKGLVISGTVTGRHQKWIEEVDPFVRSGCGEAQVAGLLARCCSTAREAVELLGRVIAERGHNGREIYMFADKDEAWYVEAYSGHQWAAVRMPDDQVAVFGNQLMIQEFDPTAKDVLCSPGLVSVPEKAGRLVRGAKGLPNLRQTYGAELVDYGNYRTWYGHRQFAPETAGAYEEKRAMPLFFRPSRKIGRRDLFALIRSRYEGSGRCPDECGDTSVRVIGSTKQATCHVISLDPRVPPERAGTIWVTLSQAEHGVFLPLNVSADRVAAGYELDQEGEFRYEPQYPSMAFLRLCTMAEQNRKWYGQGVRAYWEAFERRTMAEFDAAFAAGDAAKMTACCVRAQERAFDDARRIFDELVWYAAENNRISGDGNGATDEPEAPFRPTAAGDPTSFKAGFARADVTPEKGVLMPGYYKVREVKGVLDPLEANVLALSDGERTAFVLTLDCVDMPDAFADEARDAIAAKTGASREAVIVHATHTHTSGDLRRTANRLLSAELGAEKKRLSEAYAKTCVAAVADAAARAVADLKPARLSCGRSVARRVSFGRRYRMKDGTVRTNPGVGNPDIVGPAGAPPDDQVQVLRIDREGADPIAVLNFQTHPDVIGGEAVSADWPGFARRTLEAALGGKAKCLLVNGTEGDVNHVCVDPTPEERAGLHPDFDGVDRGYVHSKRMGEAIARAALSVWEKCAPLATGRIRFGSETVRVLSNRPKPEEMDEARRIDALHRAGNDSELPYKGMDLTTKVAAAERKIRLEHGPDHFDLPLTAIAVGDAVAFGGFPGEPFNDIGKAVKKASPFGMTILACLVNGDRGYFPFSDSYAEGGYEAESSPFGPSVADDLIAGQLKLLNRLAGTQTSSSGLTVRSLDGDWQFRREGGSWESVTVPHDWAIAGPFNPNATRLTASAAELKKEVLYLPL